MIEGTNIKLTVPFFMVTDMDRSIKFYVEGLGFSVAKTWTPESRIEWCWLERDDAAIMLQEYRSSHPQKNAEKGVGVAICFQCIDALALYEEFVSKGIQPLEPFVGNNMWAVSLKDPDGHNIHFESPTDVNEETTYSNWKKQIS